MLSIFGNEDIEQVVVMKSARVGYTKMLCIKLAWTAAHKRRNQALWQPTDEDRDSFVKTEIDPLIRDVEPVRKIASSSGKSKDSTLTQKKFVGSILHLLGGKAAKNYRRITISDAHLDELDAFDEEIEKTSSPLSLAWKRTEGAPFRKQISGSTPLIKGRSLTEKAHNECAAQMRYEITCPACEVEHPLIFGLPDKSGIRPRHGFQWDSRGVVHRCPHCNHAITQQEYAAISWKGALVSRCRNYRFGHDKVWRNERGLQIRAPKSVGLHIWTAYSEQVTWQTIVDDYETAKKLAANGDRSKLKGFINETLGETYEPDDVDKLDDHELAKRAEPYQIGVMPMPALSLFVGIDTQDSWWAVHWIAFGRDEESWVIDYQEIPGDPSQDSEWDRLHTIIQRPVRHESGCLVKPTRSALDTQGSHHDAAYRFVRKYGDQYRIDGTKGESVYGKPIKSRTYIAEVTDNGKRVKRGAKIWFIGTDTAKDLIYGRLKLPTPGPGYIHFPIGLDKRYYDGLTAEVRQPKSDKPGAPLVWTQIRPRNEPLDTMVGAIFASYRADIPKYSSAMWDKLQAAMQPDLFSAVAVSSSAATAPQSQPGQPLIWQQPINPAPTASEPRIIDPNAVENESLAALYAAPIQSTGIDYGR